MNQVIDYVISLTHLYGLVHKDKVVEIYNMQNDEKIDVDVVNEILKMGVDEGFVGTHGDYFVHDTILGYNEFDAQLRQRMNKPFYIPEKEELFKYKDQTYYEVTKEYKALLSYVTKNIVDGDELRAEVLCEDVQGVCQFGFSVQNALDVFNQRDVNFKSEKQVSEVMQLIMDLSNNTRIWENNGHTPSEIFELMERPNLRPFPRGDVPDFMGVGKSNKKVGRNDPCPCGSGKKYKKCCLGKE